MDTFFLLGMSLDLIAQVQRTHSARKFKEASDLFPFGVFGIDLWSILETVILLDNQGWRRCFISVFISSRSKNKLNFIC